MSIGARQCDTVRERGLARAGPSMNAIGMVNLVLRQIDPRGRRGTGRVFVRYDFPLLQTRPGVEQARGGRVGDQDLGPGEAPEEC